MSNDLYANFINKFAPAAKQFGHHMMQSKHFLFIKCKYMPEKAIYLRMIIQEKR